MHKSRFIIIYFLFSFELHLLICRYLISDVCFRLRKIIKLLFALFKIYYFMKVQRLFPCLKANVLNLSNIKILNILINNLTIIVFLLFFNQFSFDNIVMLIVCHRYLVLFSYIALMLIAAEKQTTDELSTKTKFQNFNSLKR